MYIIKYMKTYKFIIFKFSNNEEVKNGGGKYELKNNSLFDALSNKRNLFHTTISLMLNKCSCTLLFVANLAIFVAYSRQNQIHDKLLYYIVYNEKPHTKASKLPIT